MSNYERIKQVINASSLDGKDKDAMLDLYVEVDDTKLLDLANLYEKDASWVGKFNETRIMKRKAMKSGDSSLWQDILEKEKQYLNDLTFGLD